MDQKPAALTTSSPLYEIRTYSICVDMLKRLLLKLSCIHFPNLRTTEDNVQRYIAPPKEKTQ